MNGIPGLKLTWEEFRVFCPHPNLLRAYWISFPHCYFSFEPVLFEAFRTKQGLILPLVTAGLAVAWGVGVMGASGIPMDVFNSATPILIFGGGNRPCGAVA